MARSGLKAFSILMVGQAVSLIGTGMTRFALAVWAWEETERATPLALVGLFSFGPGIVLAIVAGAVVDARSRKLVLITADFVSAAATLAVLLLLHLGDLSMAHVYAMAAVAGAANAFQVPALLAAMTSMLDQRHYSRAHGMRSLANALALVTAPAMAGATIAMADLRIVLLFDLMSFVVAAGLVAVVRIPQPEEPGPLANGRGAVRQGLYGFRFIATRRPLLGLFLLSACITLAATTGVAILQPMILARTGSELALGTVNSAIAIGGITGGSFVSTWGGPHSKMAGILVATAVLSASLLALGVARQPIAWAVAGFFLFLGVPLLEASIGSIKQRKVPGAVQGKVFAAARSMSQLGAAIAYLIAGPAADLVFEPALTPGTPLAANLAWLVEPGAGGGMALMLILAGMLTAVVGLSTLAWPPVRRVESLLPDFG